MNSELKKIEANKVKRVILIILLCLVIGSALFLYFYLTTQSRSILREGKNVQIAFKMISIEYYGQGKSIYDRNFRDGMAQGVKERIDNIVGYRGDIIITRYDSVNREVTGFIYERNNYRVVYRKNDDGKSIYKVHYIVPVLNYEQ